ncbi:hypothetical protein M8756_10440 [Lutimaribacter sp. EGI FJ00015]|uniref:Uncharacterized protein n=1 Tax=Lutimaribacter degradans TaxID=2945989 RepID=A0ACC5ZXK8_9RHOB|nr:hypothetical protein [Lutimaribacter sp. EGI FJ00013]MCM2562565.1 hypothetical protein [Lutimaribacter sp. EGI FJ00013]MCO0613722.1 hypothetical protein [Lutimaribacter sp. EGI FJ00015]MCO0636795.1 hypothetical protein [Lutimaribacter sp. EGI FJ00014]
MQTDEAIRLDQGRLCELYDRLGPSGAEDVVCRAMEELAARLSQIDRDYGAGRWIELRKGARALAAIADQMGMATLARVGRDVTACVDLGDRVALAAVLARLFRSGEGSLTAVWDMQGLSV